MKENPRQTALAARKRQLLLDGAVFRIGIVHAKAQVAHGFRAESLLQAALVCARSFANAKLEAALGPPDGRIRRLMPLAITAFSMLSRKKISKLAIGAVLTAIAAIALIKRNKK